MTLDTDLIRMRAKRTERQLIEVGLYHVITDDIFALLNELERVTVERDALRRQVIELTPRPRQPYPTDGKAYRLEGNPGPAPYFNGSEPE